MFHSFRSGEPTPCRADSGCFAAGAADHSRAGGRCRRCGANAQATALPPAGLPCPGTAAGDQLAGTGASPAEAQVSAADALQAQAAAASAAPCRCRCPGARAHGLGGEDRRQLRSPHCSPQGGLAAAGDDWADQSGTALRPFTGSVPALRAHLRQWRDHALPAGQRLPAEGAADVAGAACAGAALVDFRSRRGGNAGANRDQLEQWVSIVDACSVRVVAFYVE